MILKRVKDSVKLKMTDRQHLATKPHSPAHFQLQNVFVNQLERGTDFLHIKFSFLVMQSTADS